MKNTLFSYIRLLLYIFLLLLVLFIYWFGFPYIGCYWNETYGILCPSCGVSRAIIAILHFNFSLAIRHNLLFTCIVFPLFALLLLNDIYIILKRLFFSQKDISWLEILFGLGG